jgi:hypothetical protein
MLTVLLLQGIKRLSTGTRDELDRLYKELHFDHLWEIEKYSSEDRYFKYLADLHTPDLGGDSVMAEICEHHLRDVLRLDLGAREKECPWLVRRGDAWKSSTFSEVNRYLRVSSRSSSYLRSSVIQSYFTC